MDAAQLAAIAASRGLWRSLTARVKDLGAMPGEIDERALTPRGAVLPEELTGERTGEATRGADDGPGLGRAVAAAYARAVRFQREQPGRTPEQALTESREPPAWEPAELADAPAGSVSWLGLGRLMEADPDAGEALWARIKVEADIV